MPFTWTPPDPLDGTAKTRSIYVTELQTATNTKRAEIGLAPISFIDQSIGKQFKLSAVEELKTAVNDLAILYGYAGGVQNPELLGRPYVDITRKYGKEVCHYPILNDLRLVLDRLVLQVKLVMIDRFSGPYTRTFSNSNITAGPLVAADMFNFPNPGSSYSAFSVDSSYVYYVLGTGNFAYFRKIRPNGGYVTDKHVRTALSDLAATIIDIVVDNNYVWCLYTGTLPGMRIGRLDKSFGNFVDVGKMTDSFVRHLTCDSNNLYAAYSDKMAKISKTGIGALTITFSENLIPSQPGGVCYGYHTCNPNGSGAYVCCSQYWWEWEYYPSPPAPPGSLKKITVHCASAILHIDSNLNVLSRIGYTYVTRVLFDDPVWYASSVYEEHQFDQWTHITASNLYTYKFGGVNTDTIYFDSEITSRKYYYMIIGGYSSDKLSGYDIKYSNDWGVDNAEACNNRS